MPCNQIREQQIDFPIEQEHLPLMKEALEAEGLKTRQIGQAIYFEGRQEGGPYVDGRFVDGAIYGAEGLDADSLKAAYAAQQVVEKFRKLGKITKKSKTHFQVHLKVW